MSVLSVTEFNTSDWSEDNGSDFGPDEDTRKKSLSWPDPAKPPHCFYRSFGPFGSDGITKLSSDNKHWLEIQIARLLFVAIFEVSHHSKYCCFGLIVF